MSVSAVAAVVSVACNPNNAAALDSTSAGTTLPNAADQTRPVPKSSKEMSVPELLAVLGNDMLCCSKYTTRCAVVAYEPELLR